jgi:hypothetical protein
VPDRQSRGQVNVNERERVSTRWMGRLERCRELVEIDRCLSKTVVVVIAVDIDRDDVEK